MDSSADMRLRAKQYREQAEASLDSEAKAMLIKAAEIWEALAAKQDSGAPLWPYSPPRPRDDESTNGG
jgi:hypothetical protein